VKGRRRHQPSRGKRIGIYISRQAVYSHIGGNIASRAGKGPSRGETKYEARPLGTEKNLETHFSKMRFSRKEKIGHKSW